MSVTPITLRLSEQELDLVRRYAQMHGTTVSDVVRRSVLERIEDEFDLDAYDKAYAAYRSDPVTYTQDEVERMLLE